MQHKEIVIIGGGPIGLTLALKLANGGKSVTILDAGMSKVLDERVLALSYASYFDLAQLNIWPYQLATPINQVHISHNGFGISKILASDVNLEHLGLTLKYTDICAALASKINHYPQIKQIPGQVQEVIPGKNFATIVYKMQDKQYYLTADLAIVAEGGKVAVTGINYQHFDYEQTAIIARVQLQNNPSTTAFEHLNKNGPLVLLPYQNSHILVWSKPTDRAKIILTSNTLMQELANYPFIKRFGNIKLMSNVYGFPLIFQVAKQRILEQVVLIGNSAQTVHPISAQGMNLGLRDVNALNEIILTPTNLPYKDKVINYAQLRATDAKFITQFTHFLARFVTGQATINQHLRSLGIVALSNCKAMQNMLTNSLIFGW